MKEKYIIFSTVITMVLFSSGEPQQGPPGGISTGSLVGFVKLYSEYGMIIEDRQGVTITVVGSDPEVSATTNSAGRYEIYNLQTGTYMLVFSKEGFSTDSLNQLFIGTPAPDYIYPTTLVQVSTTEISELDIYFPPDGFEEFIKCKVMPAPSFERPINIRFFLSESQGVSMSNYSSTFREDFEYAYEDIIGEEYAQIEFYSSGLNDVLRTYPPGTSLYIVAHACSNRNDEYTDADGYEHFSSINQVGSNFDTYTIPNSR